MVSKKITDEEIIKFINEELDDKKSNHILNIMTSDEELKLKIESLRKLDLTINLAAEKAYPIPKEFQKTVENIVAQDLVNNNVTFKKKIFDKLTKIPLFGLITGSALSGGALASVFLISFLSINTQTLVFRGNNKIINNNIPNSWFIKNDIFFALSYSSQTKEIDNNKNIQLSFDDKIFFTIIASKEKTLDIFYISSDGDKTKLYSNLNIQKGETFTSNEYIIGKPVGMDKITIIEDGNIILEKQLSVSQ